MNNLKNLKKTLEAKLAETEVGTEQYDAVLKEYNQICEVEAKKPRFSISGDTILKCVTYTGLTVLGWIGTEVYGKIKRKYGDDIKP